MAAGSPCQIDSREDRNAFWLMRIQAGVAPAAAEQANCGRLHPNCQRTIGEFPKERRHDAVEAKLLT